MSRILSHIQPRHTRRAMATRRGRRRVLEEGYEAHRIARRSAAALGRWAINSAAEVQNVAGLLGVSTRTLRHWRARWSRDRLAGCVPGRRPQFSARQVRQEYLDWLGRERESVGVMEIWPEFRMRLVRREAEDLSRRWKAMKRRKRRRRLQRLECTLPGAVLAVDHKVPPNAVEGLFESVLAARDLGSGNQMLWEPVEDQTGEVLRTMLDGEFRLHGPPLAVKTDNGSCFIDEATQKFLDDWGVEWLPSPVRRPQYNGSVEAANRWMGERTDHLAARQGRPGNWTREDLAAAREQANARSRPRGVNGPSSAEIYELRQPITPGARQTFRERVRRHREDLEAEHRRTCGLSENEPLDVQAKRKIQRTALARALREEGIFLVRRRRITPPITA